MPSKLTLLVMALVPAVASAAPKLVKVKTGDASILMFKGWELSLIHI